MPVGALAGYFGGWVDDLLMRIIDAALSLPMLLILILLSAILREVDLPLFKQNNVLLSALVIGVLTWMTVARLVRALFLTLRQQEYVTAARALGASSLLLMTSEILPSSCGPIIVESTLEIGWAILRRIGAVFPGLRRWTRTGW